MIPPVDDLDRLMAVMREAFDPIYGEAWTRRQVEDALLIGNCFYGLVGADGDPPAAGEPAAGFWMSRGGFGEEELLLFAVVPAWRRRGLGLRMLDQLAVAAAGRGAERILLEMRKGNPAEALYRSYGFVPIGERPNYYRTPGGDRIDALTFALDIGYSIET
jgi:ribosomal-protein-alanine N-acetyltransferase